MNEDSFGQMKLLELFRRKKKSAGGNPLGSVRVNETHVVYRRPDDTEDRVTWSELIEVGVLTTDEGPIQEDVFFMLLSGKKDEGCAVPQGAQDVDQLVEKIQGLPNFKNDELIKAMGCTSNNRFVCWKRA